MTFKMLTITINDYPATQSQNHVKVPIQNNQKLQAEEYLNIQWTDKESFCFALAQNYKKVKDTNGDQCQLVQSHSIKPLNNIIVPTTLEVLWRQ